MPPDCLEQPKHASRTPARDKVRPLLPQALAEGWSIRELARRAGVGQNVAGAELRRASKERDAEVDRQLSGETNRAVAVARRVRDRQIAQAERLEDLTEKAIADLETKAEAGDLSVRDLETLARLRKTHWEHTKDLAGISLAEKMALAQAKGEATGRGFAGALVDATAIEIGDGVWELATDKESVDSP